MVPQAALSEVVEKTRCRAMRELVLELGLRIDGRQFDELQPFECEVCFPAETVSAAHGRWDTF